MKYDCGLTPRSKRKLLSNWHKKFAWLPIQLGDNDCRWLEYIERKGMYCPNPYMSIWLWDYRAIEKEEVLDCNNNEN